jgi:Ca-activated chloride channel family protein
MIWMRPAFLLMLLPWLAWSVWRWRRAQQQGGWHRVMDERLLHRLNYRGGVKQQSLARGALLLAGVLLIVALAGPARLLAGGATLTAGNLIVVMDATLSMTVEDTPPSRAVRAERVIRDWAASGVFERTAVIVYSGSAHWLVPLTRDTETLALQLEQMSPYLMPQFGNRPDIALERVSERLKSLQGRNQVLWITDDASPGRIDALKAARPQVERFWLMPMGTETGGPIPLPDGSGFLNDGNRMVMPVLDRAGFRQVAAELNATLLPMEQRVENVSLTIDRGEGSDQRQLREWGYWLLLPVLLLLLPWYRRGLVYLLPLGLMSGLLWQPTPVAAANWTDPLLKNREQRAFQAYQEGDTDRSRNLTERQDLAARLAFEQGDYDQAAQLWAQLNSADAHYNRGNALASQGQLQAAIEAYDEALARTDHAQARYNKERVTEALEEQQRQEQQEQQNQEQQDQQGDGSDQPPSDDAKNQSEPGEQQPDQQNDPGQQQDETEPSGQDDAGQGEETEENADEARPSDQQGEETQAQPSLEERRRDQAVEQLLNRVPSSDGQVLQRKFQYQFQQAPTDEEPDSLW